MKTNLNIKYLWLAIVGRHTLLGKYHIKLKLIKHTLKKNPRVK